MFHNKPLGMVVDKNFPVELKQLFDAEFLHTIREDGSIDHYSGS